MKRKKNTFRRVTVTLSCEMIRMIEQLRKLPPGRPDSFSIATERLIAYGLELLEKEGLDGRGRYTKSLD